MAPAGVGQAGKNRRGLTTTLIGGEVFNFKSAFKSHEDLHLIVILACCESSRLIPKEVRLT
jgi:hypothetical protein